MCGSSDIYSVEYKCTKNDINVTTTNIIAVKLSKQKDQLIFNVSTDSHENRIIFVILPVTIIFKRMYIDMQKDIKTNVVVMIKTPTPSLCPNKIPLKKPNSGKRIVKIYINVF